MKKLTLLLFAVALASAISLVVSTKFAAAQARIECTVLMIPHGPKNPDVQLAVMPRAGIVMDVWVMGSADSPMVDVMFECTYS